MDHEDASIYIAGWKTAADWKAFRETLVVGGDTQAWQRAFQEYLQIRLEWRYLGPIRLLQKHGTFAGEGFSILAIQCTLVEFLESMVQGINYRYLRHGESPGPHEYNSSRAVFISFLCNRHPFAQQFDENLATEFYREIRCGLLHEARTRGGWRVWAFGSDGRVLDRARRIVYRDNLQSALDEFIRWYERTLPRDARLQEAFIRRVDSLCEDVPAGG